MSRPQTTQAPSENSTMEVLHAIEECRIFFDGTFTDPQLDHSEGLAIAADGAIWCGGERGQVFRIEPDGSAIEQVASTGGFCLGMAFAGDDLFVCDVKRRAVIRVDTRTGQTEPFATGTDDRPFSIPNYPALDASGRLYVSDSNAPDVPGPGLYRFDPDGTGTLWHRGPFTFANGLAFSNDGAHLYVAETFARAISRIAIDEDGCPGAREIVARIDGLPDGLAFDERGFLYVGCYEPSQILRVDPDGRVRCLVRDETAHTLCHPTNLAFRGRTLFATNLGRWHITTLDLDLPPDPGDEPAGTSR